MKDKSFILRSSRITSTKTYSTIAPAFIQTHALSSSPNSFFSTIQPTQNAFSQRQLQQELSQKDKELKDRLSKLTANLKHVEKQYKQNLKDGFENKIKSYRLQAVMERKILKQTIEETLRLNELQDMKDKYEMAIQRKQFSEFKAIKQQQMREKRLERLKNQSLQQRKKNQYELTTRAKQIQAQNKSLHDRVISEEKYKDRKKNYLQYWKQQKLRRDEFDTKKQFLEKIVTNTRKIKGLRQELENVEQRCQKLMGDKETLWKDKSSLFVTI